MTLFEQVEASLPTSDILANTIARRRFLDKAFRTTAIKASKPISTVKALPKPINQEWKNWRESVRFAFEVLHHRISDGRFIPPVSPRKTLIEIIVEVSRKHGVEINDIKKVDGYASRKLPIVKARQEFFCRARMETLNSLSSIGKFAGGFDHSTVFHGIAAHNERMKDGDKL